MAPIARIGYLDEVHWEMFRKLQDSVPENRDGRIRRCGEEFALATQRTSPEWQDLLPGECLTFALAKDEWYQATGIRDWRLDPSCEKDEQKEEHQGNDVLF
jgi:hypothetical protein